MGVPGLPPERVGVEAEKQALDEGKTMAFGVRGILSPASTSIYQQALDEGLISIFMKWTSYTYIITSYKNILQIPSISYLPNIFHYCLIQQLLLFLSAEVLI